MVRRLVQQQNVGCLSQSRAIARRLRHPPDNAACGPSKSSKPARPSVSPIRESASPTPGLGFFQGFSITDLTVSSGANSEICGTYAKLVRLRMATFPLSGSMRPERISSSVDLPEPFGPIRPMRSPSDTVKEISWNSGATPNRFRQSLGADYRRQCSKSSFTGNLTRCERTTSMFKLACSGLFFFRRCGSTIQARDFSCGTRESKARKR